MADENLSENVAALLARVAELEAQNTRLQQQQPTPLMVPPPPPPGMPPAALHPMMQPPLPPQGGALVDQLWHYLLAFLPMPIIVLAVIVFGAYHGWEYYNEAQQLAVETHLKTAKAAVETAKAAAQNFKVGDESVRVATMKADVLKKQQEANNSKTLLEAENTSINNESMRLQTMRADVASKQAQAAKARVLADAAMQKEGAQTLEDKAAKAKLRLTEFEAISNEVKALVPSIVQPGGRQRIIDALCSNGYADQIGCAASYTERYLPGQLPPTDHCVKNPGWHFVARYDTCCPANYHYTPKSKMCSRD